MEKKVLLVYDGKEFVFDFFLKKSSTRYKKMALEVIDSFEPYL